MCIYSKDNTSLPHLLRPCVAVLGFFGYVFLGSKIFVLAVPLSFALKQNEIRKMGD